MESARVETVNELIFQSNFGAHDLSVALRFSLHLYMHRSKCREMFEAGKIRPIRSEFSALP